MSTKECERLRTTEEEGEGVTQRCKDDGGGVKWSVKL